MRKFHPGTLKNRLKFLKVAEVGLAVAKKLINCPYIIGIPCSLPYNSHGRNFIEKVHPKGRIDITLIGEDNGPSMMVETTGRTLRETEAIAEIIKDLY